MVYRVYVEKKSGFDNDARSLLSEIHHVLQISSVESVRILNRYDAEGLDAELFAAAVGNVFSEPMVDDVFYTLPEDCGAVFAVEYLPGQFDQRADSAAQCISLLSQQERPTVKTARIYILGGTVSEDELAAIKKYVINPVEAREASLDTAETLQTPFDIPTEVETEEGFRELDEEGLESYCKRLGLAMDKEDLRMCRDYFRTEQRDPTITEIRMIDTYWSDHCRHTTFNTTLDHVHFEDALLQKTYEYYLATRKELGRTKPVNLMDIGTLAAKYLKAQGKLDKLDESEEINACTVKMDVEIDGVTEPWLLLFKNETHNHPTEIEPFGGAATCIGGAIRDPLSGRAYVYGAMRLTGAADPLKPLSETLPGKLSQRKIVTTAAAGYSSYGNQIGLATGIVDELYHEGYAAKRMEIGAVIGAAPEKNVRRQRPEAGDVVILLGGKTGRDGCGGATGSSKSHTVQSLEQCGAEVQKGNAPEERKLQRLFRNSEASRMIKRCNDFGAGGVSVAIGELADGLDIDLNAVPKKYEGLDGTELAISESQERMAVVVEAKDVSRFMELADSENLEATAVAVVKAEPRLTMRWNGKTIVDVSRAFLDTNGAEKHIEAHADALTLAHKDHAGGFAESYKALASDLNCCSKRGLSERFDSTIGAGGVLMPFGGKYQLTPVQAMVQKVSLEKGHTDCCTLMSWGYNPYLSEKSPYHGAYTAVVESVSKLIASGSRFEDVYLTFQEYFQSLGKDPRNWGKPLSALLGAFQAQMDLGVAAIGGKDSMSGSFEKLHVPPTLVSFAVTTDRCGNIVSPEFKKAGDKVVWLRPEKDENGLPVKGSLLKIFDEVSSLMRAGKAVACYTPGMGGAAEAVMKMAMGNGFGFRFSEDVSLDELFDWSYGSFVVELNDDADCSGMVLGAVTEKQSLVWGGEELSMAELCKLYEDKLESVYPCNITQKQERMETVSYTASAPLSAHIKSARPKVLIPVFPGTNCEIDSARAVEDAGAEPQLLVINNLSAEGISRSVESFAKAIGESQMIFIPGGFSGGDEPDGSGKFITAFFRNAAIKESVEELLDKRDGLICGICNGFQALVKLGLVPFGKIIDTDASCPTLTFNTIGRHQSKIVRTRVASNRSPWLSLMEVGQIVNVPISHGEGRFVISDELLSQLLANGQIATQYVDLEGKATDDVRYNPNNSTLAIEGITSPDGRVFGKMGHAERVGDKLYQNVPGDYQLRMFESAVRYFK